MHGANESTYFFRGVETTPRILNIVEVVAGWVKGYLDWRRQQADIAILQGLSARQLKDMGLYPEVVGRIASRRSFPLSMDTIDPRF